MLDIIICVFFISFVIISLVFSFKQFSMYFDSKTISLAWVYFTIDVFVLVNCLFFLDSYIQLSAKDYQFFYNLGCASVYIGIMSFIYALNIQSSFGFAHISSLISGTIFAMLSAFNIANMFSETPQFLYITMIAGEWYVITNLITKIFFAICISTFIYSMIAVTHTRKHEMELSEPRRVLFIRLLSIFLILLFMIITLVLLAFPISVKESFMLLTPVIIVLFSILMYISSTQTLFLLTRGMTSIAPLIREGYIGHMVAAMTDSGPSTIYVSPVFESKRKLSDTSLQVLSIGLMSLIGTNISADKVTLIPIPNESDLSALTFSFYTKNPSARDSRLQENTGCLYALLFPSSLKISLENVYNVSIQIHNRFKLKNTLEEIANEEFLIETTKYVMRKLI